MVTCTIDGIKIEVPEETTVLNAAKQAGIHIPTLCYLKGVNAIGACRICLVEVVGNPNLQAACMLPVTEGMEVLTHSLKVMKSKKITLELLLSNHDRECLTCIRNKSCELQTLAEELHVMGLEYDGERLRMPIDDASPSVVRNPNKCVLCKRCVHMCTDVQGIGAISATNRGFKTIVESVFSKSLEDTCCINCGQCINACPVGALTEKDEHTAVWDAIYDPKKFTVVQPAPAVRAALGEEFGFPMGTPVTGKLAAALRRMGFDRVFDTNFGADLTIMEEGTELIERIQNNGVLPMITSCSPGWIKFCEKFFPDFIPNLSTCKSPHQMLGAIIKSYYAEKMGIDPKDVFTVSVMPCVAKKFEKTRDGESGAGVPDVDAVISTRELARMLKSSNIDFANLPDEKFDDMLGDSTGAADIFGVTGGVMEAALRTVADVLTGQNLEKIDYNEVRGLDGIKEASVMIGDMEVKVAVAHGTGNAKKLLQSIRDGKKSYHFIEIMGCPGGCVTGGGQPIVSAKVRNFGDPRKLRAKALYAEDEGKTIRKSHKNPSIIKLYDEYLEKPGSHLSHRLLHTYYAERPKYKD